MWSTYTKTFVFRDCFDEEIINDNVEAINKMLSSPQRNGEIGVFICTDLICTNIATHFEASRNEDDGELTLSFAKDGKQFALVTLDHYKEVWLQFEIEENLEDEDIVINYCTIKGFKEYQK